MNLSSQRIPISRHFFCDGHGYVLTSASLGGSDLNPSQFSDLVLDGSADDIAPLLEQGICLPILFESDCALDQKTLFVIGQLMPQEEQDWCARLTWKLNIPCGKLILLCSCVAEDVAHAISGEPPQENFMIFQVIDVPPDFYEVNIYAYPGSPTFLETLDDDEYERYEAEMLTLDLDDYDNKGNLTSVGYITRLSPLMNKELDLPETNDAWLEKFTFR
jgi:hypothetical protein